MGLAGALDFFTGVDGLICLAVGAILGVLAGPFLRGGGLGTLGNVIVGALGGVLGGYFFDWINIIDVGDYADPIIAGAVGAVVLLAVAGFFFGRQTTPQP